MEGTELEHLCNRVVALLAAQGWGGTVIGDDVSPGVARLDWEERGPGARRGLRDVGESLGGALGCNVTIINGAPGRFSVYLTKGGGDVEEI